jgi:WD40 repeat protein
MLASGSWDRTIRFWDMTGKELTMLKGHEDEVTTVAFSADGKWLASGSRDGTALVWMTPK